MATRKRQTTDEPEVFEQVQDAHGVTQLDRPPTPAEAREQDEANRRAFAEERGQRFGDEAA